MSFKNKYFILAAVLGVSIVAFWLLGYFSINFDVGKANMLQIFQKNLVCTDSDGGLDYYTPGRTTQTYQYLWSSKKLSMSYSDGCDADKNLVEYYCSGNNIRLKRYTCPNGCENGACKQQTQNKPGAVDKVVMIRGDASMVEGGSFQILVASKKFLASYQDNADFIVFVPTSVFMQKQQIDRTPFGMPVRDNIKGIGMRIGDSYNQAGSSVEGKLQALVMSPRLGIKEFDPIPNYPLVNLKHEIGHRWGVYLTGVDNSLGILDEMKVHWNQYFSCPSIMSTIKNNWVDNHDGTFTRPNQNVTEHRKFNSFDLYAMGLIGKNQVQPCFVIDNPVDITPTQVKGNRRDITIQDIINIEGERSPNINNSQKDFSVSFVVVADPSESDSDVNNVLKIVNEQITPFADSWSEATQGLSKMDILAPVSIKAQF